MDIDSNKSPCIQPQILKSPHSFGLKEAYCKKKSLHQKFPPTGMQLHQSETSSITQTTYKSPVVLLGTSDDAWHHLISLHKKNSHSKNLIILLGTNYICLVLERRNDEKSIKRKPKGNQTKKDMGSQHNHRMWRNKTKRWRKIP